MANKKGKMDFIKPNRPKNQEIAGQSSTGLPPNYILCIPDNILLHIFKELAFKDLVAVKRVCRRFRTLANDRSLWKDVEISPCIVTVTFLHKLLRIHFPKDMRSLKLRGYLKYYEGKPGWSKNVITNNFLKELQQHCSHLNKFCIFESDIRHIRLLDFPDSLTILQLQSCHFESARNFFSNISSSRIGKGLTELDLSDSMGLSDTSLREIANLNSLRILSLRRCSKILDGGIQHLADHLHKLEVLDLGLLNIADETNHNVSFVGILRIVERMKFLKILNIKFTINDENSIKTLTDKFPHIKFISD